VSLSTEHSETATETKSTKQRKRLRPTVLDIILALAVLLIFVNFMGRFVKTALNTEEYAFRIIPLDKDHISNRLYVLEGIDFSKLFSVTVTLNKPRPWTNIGTPMGYSFFLIPDYSPSDFYCARVSSIAPLPSGIMHYIDGNPHDFVQISPVTDEPQTYRIFFGSGQDKLPRPRQGLYFMAYPLSQDLNVAASGATIEFEDGHRFNIDLTPSFSKPLCLFIALAFLPFLLWLDNKVISRVAVPPLRNRIRRRIRLTRLFGGLVTLFLTSIQLHEFSTPGSPVYKPFTVLMLILFAWIFFGRYPIWKKSLTQTTVRKSSYIKKLAIIASFILILLTPILLPGFAIIHLQKSYTKDILDNLIFRGKQVKRGRPDQKIVLCMGGSSTHGDPFGPKWPYDYPTLMENILKQHNLDVLVANAGIPATNITYANKYLPQIIDRLKPNIVTLNYLHNDTELYAVRTFSRKLLFFIPNSWKGPPHRDFYRMRLTETIQSIRSKGVTCILVLEPDFDYVYFGVDHYSFARSIIREVAAQMDVQLVDPNPIFAENRDKFLFVDDHIHFTKFGSELLAKILSEEILKTIQEQSHSD